jgi:glucose-6-phosphate isomerase
LEKLSEELKLTERFQAMFRGDKINSTENRSVLHVALRKPESEKLELEGNDVIPDIHKVLKRIHQFSDNVRSKETYKIRWNCSWLHRQENQKLYLYWNRWKLPWS